MDTFARWWLPAATAAVLPAQYALHESRGPLAGSAVAVAVDSGAAGVAVDAASRVRGNGFLDALQTLPAGSSLPNLGAILAPLAPGLDVDDFSLGRDDVMFDAAGDSDVPASSWAVVSFSLRTATGTMLPGTPTSRIREEAALGPIGASLFSWVQDGQNLPAEVRGEVERSHSRQELGAGPTADVDALDVTAVLGANQGSFANVDPEFVALNPAPTSVYFTVSHATRHLVPDPWWGLTPVAGVRSGATIFVTTRLSSGGWSTPAVWKHHFQLGLGQDEDIDGLAVDLDRTKILFSCVGATQPSQFMVVDWTTDAAIPVPAKDPSGQPVTSAVGAAGNDDVDAICTLDPAIGTAGGPPIGGPPIGGDEFGNSCGVPRPGALGIPQVDAVAHRRWEGGPRRFDTWMVGWPPGTGITSGLAIPFVTLGVDSTLIPLGPVLFRDIADPVPGNPCHASIVIPATLTLENTVVTFRWAAIDANLTELAEARPVQVFL